MNKTGFLALTVVTAALIVGAIVFQPGASTTNPTEGARFFPDLDAKVVNAVDRIKVTAKGETFTLERKDGKWLAKEKGGYPVRFEKIKEALFSLSQLKQFERKTSDASRFDALDLEDPAKKGSSSKRLAAFVGDKQVADVIVGKSNSKELLFGRSLVYVRLPKGKQAWLAVGDPKLAASVGDWLDRTLIDVKTARIKDVVQTDDKDGKIVVGQDKAGSGNFALRNKPEGRALKGPRFVRYIGEGINNVSLEDVQPASKIDFTKNGVGGAVFRTFDGLVVTVKIARTGGKKADGKKDEKFWLTFTASVDEKALLKKKPAKGSPLKAADDVRKEAKAINARTKGWAYEVSSTVTRFMRYKMDDLLKPGPKKTEKKTDGKAGDKADDKADVKKAADDAAKKAADDAAKKAAADDAAKKAAADAAKKAADDAAKKAADDAAKAAKKAADDAAKAATKAADDAAKKATDGKKEPEKKE